MIWIGEMDTQLTAMTGDIFQGKWVDVKVHLDANKGPGAVTMEVSTTIKNKNIAHNQNGSCIVPDPKSVMAHRKIMNDMDSSMKQHGMKGSIKQHSVKNDVERSIQDQTDEEMCSHRIFQQNALN